MTMPPFFLPMDANAINRSSTEQPFERVDELH
jgi:hypothetical protein